MQSSDSSDDDDEEENSQSSNEEEQTEQPKPKRDEDWDEECCHCGKGGEVMCCEGCTRVCHYKPCSGLRK